MHEEYIQYALANNLIKFVKLTCKEPELRIICRFDEDSGKYDAFQRQTVDCESELIRAKQMKYYPIPK